MTQNSQKVLPDYSQWPTKEQTAVLLECSTKTVEKFAGDGKLQTVRWRRPSGGPKIALYHPVDVEKLRRTRLPDVQSAFVMPVPQSSPEPESVSQKSASTVMGRLEYDGIPQLVTAFVEAARSQKLLGMSSQNSQKLDVPLHHRVYLTIREAAAYAGRPERHLRAAIQSGSLPVNRDGHMRVKRADLDKF